MGLHPANKPATRHVNMRMHMLRHHVELGHVCTPFCPTFDMVADYMTKATPKPTHERHNSRYGRSEHRTPAHCHSASSRLVFGIHFEGG